MRAAPRLERSFPQWTRFMTVIVEFRSRRNEADCVCPSARKTSRYSASAPLNAGAEIILMPLNWLRQLSSPKPRKALNRRFAMREAAAPA
jgi:hypothetical protein